MNKKYSPITDYRYLKVSNKSPLNVDLLVDGEYISYMCLAKFSLPASIPLCWGAVVNLTTVDSLNLKMNK